MTPFSNIMQCPNCAYTMHLNAADMVYRCGACPYVRTALAMTTLYGPVANSSASGPITGGYTSSSPIGPPVEVRDTTKEAAEALRRLKTNAATCDDEYPHKCPYCGNAAFVGLNKVDCKANCKDSQ